MAPRQCFIVPDLDGPISGGTLYNRELVTALRAAGADCAALELNQAASALARDQSALFWLDSLFLAALPELAPVAPGRIGLITHYLPSLLDHGEGLAPADLDAEERFALEHAARFLVPSEFMQQLLERLGARGEI